MNKERKKVGRRRIRRWKDLILSIGVVLVNRPKEMVAVEERVYVD